MESTRRPAAHVAPGSAQWPRATPGARVWAPRRSYSFALRVVNKSMVAASTLLCLLAIRTLERRETQKHLRITENNNGDRKRKKKSVRKKNTPLPPTNLTAASRGRAAPAQARAHWLARRGRGAPIGRAACQSGAGRGRARRRGRGACAEPVSQEAAESLQSLPPPHSTGSSAAVARPRGEERGGRQRPAASARRLWGPRPCQRERGAPAAGPRGLLRAPVRAAEVGGSWTPVVTQPS